MTVLDIIGSAVGQGFSSLVGSLGGFAVDLRRQLLAQPRWIRRPGRSSLTRQRHCRRRQTPCKPP